MYLRSEARSVPFCQGLIASRNLVNTIPMPLLDYSVVPHECQRSNHPIAENLAEGPSDVELKTAKDGLMKCIEAYSHFLCFTCLRMSMCAQRVILLLPQDEDVGAIAQKPQKQLRKKVAIKKSTCFQENESQGRDRGDGGSG